MKQILGTKFCLRPQSRNFGVWMVSASCCVVFSKPRSKQSYTLLLTTFPPPSTSILSRQNGSVLPDRWPQGWLTLRQYNPRSPRHSVMHFSTQRDGASLAPTSRPLNPILTIFESSWPWAFSQLSSVVPTPLLADPARRPSRLPLSTHQAQRRVTLSSATPLIARREPGIRALC